MTKYRKKPVEIEAVQWDGMNTVEILEFARESASFKYHDAVIFANDGSVLDGTYKQVRYIQEQRYQQLAEVARNLFKRTLVAYGGEDVSIVEIDDYRKQLEELGVEL